MAKYYKAARDKGTGLHRPGFLTDEALHAIVYASNWLNYKDPEDWIYVYEYDIDMDRILAIDCDMHHHSFGPNLTREESEKIMPGFYATGDFTHKDGGDNKSVIIWNEPTVGKMVGAYKSEFNQTFDPNLSSLSRDHDTEFPSLDDLKKEKIHKISSRIAMGC